MNIIEKLNKIDVKELQTIDYAKSFNKLKSQPEVIVSAAVILVAIFLSFKIYNNTQDEMKSEQRKIKALEEKIAAYEGYKNAQADFNKFIEKIPQPISDDNLMNLLTDFADKRKVRIESFSPLGGKNSPLADTSGLSLIMSTEDYKNLWLFIHDIEESNSPIYISRLKILPAEGKEGASTTKIGVQLDVISVNIKKS
jgi:hypothetical protein